jgi:hypothetical protein
MVHLTVHGSSQPTRTNYLDLDPAYKDAWGLPLLRMTFDFPENDIKMSAYTTGKTLDIGSAMGGKTVSGAPRKAPYTTTIYQTTHNTGGAIMGDNLPALERHRRQISKRRVSAPWIVEAFDEGEQGHAYLSLRLEPAAGQEFAFERSKKLSAMALS